MKNLSLVIRQGISGCCAGALVLLLTAGSVAAQPGNRPQMDPAERVEQMLVDIDENVGIADEQADLLRPIFLEESEQRRELFEQYGRGNREAMQAAMESVRAETNELVAEVLDEEQMAKYLEWQESRPRGPGGPPRGNRPGGNGR